MSAPVFATFGCRLNAYETEAMKRLASDAGLTDTVVVNSCAVTEEAVRKARREVRRLKRAHPAARVVVTGCAAQTAPETFQAMPDVDLVLGNAEKLRPESWAEPFSGRRVRAGDIMAETGPSAPRIDGFGTRARAYVQIQNGCDHRCTFCIIPYGRGNSRSVPTDVVTDQIARLTDRGFNEVVLTGVDLTGWGADLPGAPRLGDLVSRILTAVPDLPRLRLSSIDGVEADPALIDALSEPRLMPHLHLSLQSGDDLILKRMKRRHLRADALAFVAEARRRRPDIAFGADLIAGFPTETDAAFENTRSLVAEAGLTWLHVFPFSPRPGTPAARMPEVDPGVIRDRATRLRAEGEAARRRHLQAQPGRRHRVLTEGPRMGRTEHFAEVRFAADQPTGTIVETTIAGSSDTHLLA